MVIKRAGFALAFALALGPALACSDTERSAPVGGQAGASTIDRGSAGLDEPAGAGGGGGQGVPEVVRPVRIVYLVPSDRDENPLYTQALIDGLRSVQRWFYDRLAVGKTFALEGDGVRVIKTDHDAAWYVTNRNIGIITSLDPYSNTMADAEALAGAAEGDPSARWVIFADIEPTCEQKINLSRRGRFFVTSPELLSNAENSPVRCAPPPADPPADRPPPNPCFWAGVLSFHVASLLGIDGPRDCFAADGIDKASPLMCLG
jgi:hypothetical protein